VAKQKKENAAAVDLEHGRRRAAGHVHRKVDEISLLVSERTQQGGVEVIEQRNIAKSDVLYQAIDQSSLYHNAVENAFRSRMNVPFVLADEALNESFLAAAEANGLFELKAIVRWRYAPSIYNAMPEAVFALCEFMAEFERTH